MEKWRNIKRKIKAIKKLFNNNPDSLSRDEINKIRTKLYKKQLIHGFLSTKPNLNDDEQRVFKRIPKYLKKLVNDLSKRGNYQKNYLYGIDQLFDEGIYYKPFELKSAFNGNYVLYESNGDEIRSLSVLEYLSKIRPYLYDLIEEYSYNSSWKIKILAKLSFISLTDSTVRQELYSKSDNVNILHAVDNNGVIGELFDTFLKRYQDGLETKMTGSSYFFEKVDLLEYHFHKVTLKGGSSYIPSPEWIAYKKCTINPQNTEDNNCFQYSIVAALNHQKISNHSERISNFKPFINNYNWNDLEFPAGHKDYSAFEQNNSKIALNILYVPYNTKEMLPSYISKHNKTGNIQANLLMITDNENNWHYLAIKSISGLLHGITSTNHGDHYCLNCFHLYRTLNALKNHEKLCENHDYCNVKMPNDDNKYISSTLLKISLRVPIVVYAEFECLLFKIESCDLICLILKRKICIYLVDTL